MMWRQAMMIIMRIVMMMSKITIVMMMSKMTIVMMMSKITPSYLDCRLDGEDGHNC